MKLIDLSGAWRLRAASKKRWIQAAVPGCVHADLLDAGVIDDPLTGMREADARWIGGESWIYEREFATPKVAPGGRVWLRCDGLDTLATVAVNGAEVGRADNMHRVWRFDIGDLLRAEENTLSIRFDPPAEWIARRQAERPLPVRPGGGAPAGLGWLRKMSSAFGSEWGPALVGCGIWRPIGLEVCEDARITRLDIRQIHGEDGGVSLDVVCEVERVDDALPLTASARLNYKGTFVAEARTLLPEDGRARFNLKVRNAQRWWPNGMGEQPLYELVAEVGSPTRKAIDSWSRRIGLRTLRLDRSSAADGGRFQFVVNGVPFFAKGANWIPPDALITRPTRVEYARLAKAVSVANMNMLRVWGGGIYEQDWFYDLCDEYGICVWQDFMFADAAYPIFDAAWLENVRAEAEQNIMRLRHHTCLALWCGNSEIEQEWVGPEWTERQMAAADYQRLFGGLLPDLVARLAPDHDYWPSSPHTPGAAEPFGGANHPGAGDVHFWGVGRGSEPFHAYRAQTPRFCSAFGLPSYPEPRQLRALTGAEGVRLDDPALRHHLRIPQGDAVIRMYREAYFPTPKDDESAVWMSQIQQGYAMKIAVEHWRRARPACMGTLFWQLNDCWPAVSGSSLDHEGNWKALHYFARKFFAPILVTALEDLATGVIEVYVHNDLRQTFNGSIKWRIGDMHGRILREAGCPLVIEPGTVRRLGVLKMGDLVEKLTPENLVVWLSIVADDGYVLSSNVCIFRRPREMRIVDPDIQADIRPWDDHCYAVTLTTERPAFWCWLEIKGCNAKLDDNFVHLPPGSPVRIRVTPARNMKIDEFRERLMIRSAWNLIG